MSIFSVIPSRYEMVLILGQLKGKYANKSFAEKRVQVNVPVAAEDRPKDHI